MENRFHSDLEQLKMKILQMATLAEKALEKSIKALVERDDGLAKEVLDGDREIDLLEVEVDRHSLRLLALDQPMARDLRFIIGNLRIAVELERIGDQAVNIAQRTRTLNSHPPLPRNLHLEELGDTALDMLRTVISSFVNQNADLATDVCKMDDIADDLNYRILKDSLDYMANEAPAVQRSVETIIAARCLERAADQATNIAESVIFMVKGVNIKHHCQAMKESEYVKG
ncbi:MAG: phosphate signaling complex protein PhoU [Syntrophobacteraceae bacterium]|jgi:phosphate transport system protein